MLISAIVVHLALPFTNGVICSLPDAHSPTEFLTLSKSTTEAQVPSFQANDSSSPAEYPELEPQTGAHGIATNTVWDPMLVMVPLPAFVLRSPLTVSTDRFATNSNAFHIWRLPIPLPSSI